MQRRAQSFLPGRLGTADHLMFFQWKMAKNATQTCLTNEGVSMKQGRYDPVRAGLSSGTQLIAPDSTFPTPSWLHCPAARADFVFRPRAGAWHLEGCHDACLPSSKTAGITPARFVKTQQKSEVLWYPTSSGRVQGNVDSEPAS